MTTLYVIRHAEAEGNLKRTFQGRTDAMLTEKGFKQADLLGERFKNIKLDKIYASPLKRTIATAEGLNKYHNLEIIPCEGVIEINGGIYENLSWDEIKEKYPEKYNMFWKSIHLFEAENGERMIDVYDRVKNSILDIVKENKDKDIAVVSHGGAIKNFMCYVHDIPFEQISSLCWVGNTSVSKYEIDDSGKFTIIYEDDCSHLSKDEKTFISFDK